MRHDDHVDALNYNPCLEIGIPQMQTIYSYDPATCNKIHSIQSMHLNQTEQYMLDRIALNPNTVFINKAENNTNFFIWKGILSKQVARQVKNWKHISYDRLTPQLKAYILIAG